MNRNSGSAVALTQKDAEFIENLIVENMHHINNVIYSTLGYKNRYLAEDAINEFYLLMCEKISTLKVHTCPKAWILVAARRTAQGMIHKYKKDTQSVPIDEILYELGETDVFEDAVFEIWLENKVPEKLIANLTKREREIYRKIYIEEKKPKEIANELNISANAVRNINKNLKDKIKKDIKRKNF